MKIMVYSIEERMIANKRIKRLANVMKSRDAGKTVGLKLNRYTQPAFKAL